MKSADVRFVEIDETSMYHEEFLRKLPKRNLMRRIVAVYCYDANEATYCCEITPSRWLEPVENRAEFNDAIPDEEYDAWDEEICVANIESEGMYMQCRSVERLKEVAKYQTEEDDDEDTDGLLDRAIDAYRTGSLPLPAKPAKKADDRDPADVLRVLRSITDWLYKHTESFGPEPDDGRFDLFGAEVVGLLSSVIRNNRMKLEKTSVLLHVLTEQVYAKLADGSTEPPPEEVWNYIERVET